jgi:hypothetical protein
MNAKEFDQKFEAREDITPYLDLSQAKRRTEQKNLNINLPVWLIELIDQEADRLGVTPQALIQTSLTEHLTVK